MTAQVDHYCFTQPEDENLRLWKYMDFTKFVALISSQKLFLCRSDLFRDPHEGSFSKMNKKMNSEIFSSIPEDLRENAIKMIYAHAKWSRSWTYINCWHANEFESAAMWDLYAKTEEAIAIDTSYQKLKECLPEKSFLGLVNYIDYEKEIIPVNNTFHPYMYKRKSFEHEREARVLIQELPILDGKMDNSAINDKSGLHINVNINSLISNIYVSPNSSNWLTDLVSEISEKYLITAPIVKSDLYNDPLL